MRTVDERLRDLAERLGQRVDTSGVHSRLQERVKKRHRIAAARVPTVAAVALIIALGGWLTLSRAFSRVEPSNPIGIPRETAATSTPGTASPSPSQQATMDLTGTFAFESTKGDLYLVPADTGVAAKLLSDAGGGLSWSPDGSKIAFARGISEGTGEIRIADATTGDTSLVAGAGGPQYPTWSPTGDRLAFMDEVGNIYTVGAEGTQLQQITDYSDKCAEHGPVWSPKGDFIVVTRDCEEAIRSGIYRMSPSGAGMTPILLTKASVYGLSVSPDGQTIVFAKGYGGIHLMSADGANERQLTDDRDFSPVWSGDGTTIGFIRDSQIWATSPEGGAPIQVTHLNGVSPVELAWSATTIRSKQ